MEAYMSNQEFTATAQTIADAAQESKQEEQSTYGFANDIDADEAIQQIIAIEQECDRLCAIARAQIEKAQLFISGEQERATKKTEPHRAALAAYLETVSARETKTQRKYRLYSGTLTRRFGGMEYQRDNAALLPWLEENAASYIKTSREPMWSELKKILTFMDGAAVMPSGEVVPGVTVMQKPDTFKVEISSEVQP
jgi:hypothetical protein